MGKWREGATTFEVSVIRAQNKSEYSHIPKPVMKWLGNPNHVRFTIHKRYVTMAKVD